MSEPDERQLGDLFKLEADALLFDDLHFDERLQKRVRERIRDAGREIEETDISHEIRGGRGQKQARRSRLWQKVGIYGFSAAMLMVILIAAVVGLPGSGDEIVLGDPPVDIVGGTEMTPLGTEGGIVGGVEGSDTGVNVLSATDPVALQSVEEAHALLGEAWKEPSYVVDAYELGAIEAYDVVNGKAERIALIYENGNGQSYTVTITNTGAISINGSIAQEEVVKIEQSMQ